MKAQRPPVRIICPGKVYRRDIPTPRTRRCSTRSKAWWWTSTSRWPISRPRSQLFAREMFGPRSTVRFRPSFFPFTEPSAEVDVRCFECGGDGCRFCKESGWLEILGSGMVHPNVLRNVGYDPEEVTGWAFGMGIDRVAMLKYGIDDIRLFFDNDLRFLQQFAGCPGDEDLVPLAPGVRRDGARRARGRPIASPTRGSGRRRSPRWWRGSPAWSSGEIEGIERDLGVSAAGHHNRSCGCALPDRRFSVVCGAPNAAPGRAHRLRAAGGARCPDGRGQGGARSVASSRKGILCSEKELGLSDDHSGRPRAARRGAARRRPRAPTWASTTGSSTSRSRPNRPDALSVVGVAREVAALTGAPFRFPAGGGQGGRARRLPRSPRSTSRRPTCARASARA